MTQKTIGRYEIRKELGRGGMGAVYLAHDPVLGREVAVKLLPSYFAQEPEFSSRFAREARTVAGLDHHAIVPVHDYGEDEIWPYFVMRYMRGGSLKDRLAEGPMDLTEVARIVVRIAGALDKAHSKGVIHRDLKPANILFDGEGQSYLADFGIVHLAERSENFTRTGNTLGTPAYMSPEQVRADAEIDGRSDVYSLGIVLFEMLSGEAPYVDDSVFQVQSMHVSAPVPNLLERRPDLPTGIQQVIDRVMAKDRDDRYQTAGALAAALERVVNAAAQPAGERPPLAAADDEESGAEEELLTAPESAVEQPAPDRSTLAGIAARAGLSPGWLLVGAGLLGAICAVAILAIALASGLFDGPAAESTAEPTEADTGELADAGAAPSPESTEEMLVEEEPAEITLRLYAGFVGQELELTESAVAAYMALNPHVTVEVIATSDLAGDRLDVYRQLFEDQTSAGDVFQIDSTWVGELAEHLVDLNAFGGAQVAGNHFAANIANNTVGGRLVALPWFTDAGLLYYRADLLEKYGWDGPPETWDELEEMAKDIQEGERIDNPDFWGFVWQGADYQGLTCNALEWIKSNNGGTIVSKDKVITINNENAIAMVDRAAGWVGDISPAGVTGMTEEPSRSVWQAASAAFMRNWSYAYSLGSAADSVIAGLFDIAPLPAGQGGSAACLGGWDLAVSRYSENPDQAADLALFMANRDNQKARAIGANLNPTIKALYQDPDVLEAAPHLATLGDVIANGFMPPSNQTADKYSVVSGLFHNEIHIVLTGDNDAAAALAELELDLEFVLGFSTGAP